MNFLAKVKTTKNKITSKIVSVGMAVCAAVTCLAMSAFAESGVSMDSTIDTVVESMTTNLTSLVSKAAIAIAGVVGIGLTIFAVKWVVSTLKSFFAKLAK